MLLVLLSFSIIKLLLPVEKAGFPVVIPKPVPGIRHQQGFQLCPISAFGLLFLTLHESLRQVWVASAEAMPQGHTS